MCKKNYFCIFLFCGELQTGLRIEATGGSTEAGVVCLFGRHHKQQLESETRRCCLASNLVQRPPPRGLLSVFEHSLEL